MDGGGDGVPCEKQWCGDRQARRGSSKRTADQKRRDVIAKTKQVRITAVGITSVGLVVVRPAGSTTRPICPPQMQINGDARCFS